MAVVKAGKGGKSLSGIMDYVDKRAEIRHGVNCSDEAKRAKDEMQLTKEVWNKESGREYKHYIQSWPKGEVTPQQANEMGVNLAEKSFPGHEAYVVTHADKDHIHNHIVVNSVNFENGKKLHLDKDF